MFDLQNISANVKASVLYRFVNRIDENIAPFTTGRQIYFID